MIDGHGDDLHLYGTKTLVNFSTNIFNRVDHSALLRHLAGMPSLLGSYPEPEPRSLEKRIADAEGIDGACAMVTNGATDAIYLIAQAFRGSKSAVVEPTFREYSDACTLHAHHISHLSSLEVPDGTELLWMCNPNNPTGTVIPREQIIRTIDSHPATLFIVDQAYGDYTNLPLLTAADAADRPNLILLKSLTKRYAVPGLRIGMLFASRTIMNRLRAHRIPWAVNAPAIEAARFLMDHSGNYRIDAKSLHREAMRLADAFREMGIEVSDSECNFILCRLPHGTASQLKDYLIDTHGFLIRDASNFYSLTPQHFRVAAQLPEENTALINAVRQWMHSC